MTTPLAIVLSDEQESAKAAILAFARDPSRQEFQLEGLAGTGKTTLLSHLAKQLPNAQLCAPTGKAAAVLRRKAGSEFATTIHRAFYQSYPDGYDANGDLTFVHKPRYRSGELEGRLVFLDEMSMIPLKLGMDVQETGAKIVASGDTGQLPPVSGAPYFTKPDVTLRKIQRQAAGNPIIRQAHNVRDGLGYKTDLRPDGTGVMVHRFNDGPFPVRPDVVLCWTKAVRDHLNLHCRMAWHDYTPDTRPQPGEPVMCLRNNYTRNVFNGEIYTLAEPYQKNDSMVTLNVGGTTRRVPASFVGFPRRNETDSHTPFAFAYAMSVHKAQGSEWDTVALIDHYDSDDAHKWLYTGITRAAKMLIICPFKGLKL